MKDLDSVCRTSLRVLGAIFAVGGLSFLLAPNLIVETANWVGRHLGKFDEAPSGDLKLWVCLSFAYMSLVTALAFMSAHDPVRYLHLLPLLILGKATSSLSGLGFYLAGRRCFIYLATFAVDGSIVLLVLAIWSYYRYRAERSSG